MKVSDGGGYDPETITLLRSVLDEAWDALPPEQRARTTKMAMCMLKLAAQGERDPVRLRSRAVLDVVVAG